ncbi:undecaprenyldiphospho-muramoylpentapeptide beta-N-acetylglucosaminyltransferase [Entomospira entomophila]|uniref:UDP-N-acetylglucosamine--N-acetylmuramyl-(pentapeptide) pyrophosphoryl-undecaprenol N-acetylglucosamine transferase n=1 Tax=Entomospira entomophila TaxID=2719988 RepID=A0A968GA77_9SPIO|nr:undecaprenyldiphospho-muramoylpentapeptide beta-N-acetylglucosaminyltransferase [Entomospira entomophilus]NIZ40881.1 undecaprenyldiphospho-muramoylpentapeptide beta-N-acetylglucosaminyltransferase [Entomospira entomophilus]WDI35094.1 undecaprenyldiphospho-muramoylpentapeptide beta-N-acetylglucosaminyltransferase [Entomospira entomophilus]
MKIAFTGGGTGGHIYPGLAIIEALQSIDASTEFLWIGEIQGMEEKIIGQTKIPFKGIHAGKLRRYFSLKNFSDLLKILLGLFDAYAILYKERPDLLFSKGGFVAVPSVWAAWLLKIPIFIHESDYKLGLANRLSAPFTKRIFISFPQTIEQINNQKWQQKILYSGSPVRASLKQGNRYKGRKQWLTDESQLLILVMGGSQGAKAINDLMIGYLPVKLDGEVIIHQTGILHEQYQNYEQDGYYPRAYFHDDLADLIAAADLIISRAGAGAITEFGIMQKSVILLPLAGHQSENAKWLLEKEAVEVIYPQDVTQNHFNTTVKELLSKPSQRRHLSKTLHALIKDNADTFLAEAIIQELSAGSDISLEPRGNNR